MDPPYPHGPSKQYPGPWTPCRVRNMDLRATHWLMTILSSGSLQTLLSAEDDQTFPIPLPGKPGNGSVFFPIHDTMMICFFPLPSNVPVGVSNTICPAGRRRWREWHPLKNRNILWLDYTVLKKDMCKGHYLGLDTLKCSNVLINISVGDFYENC